MRVGHGCDAHRFSDDESRPLWLGLVLVEGPGLEGHSDADVVTHALCDALLGAAGLGDLGEHFSSENPSLAGIESRRILSDVVTLLSESGWKCVNADVTVVAQHPRLAPYRGRMQEALSAVVGSPVSVKATTTDGLGFTGRGEGVAAFAVCIVEVIE